mmetsp:Transcript_8040/g.16952  ORF Transcript_8040/g.16952 Transcript_8040/m.16952 type:complete len:219 (-) Transcript_8040:1203-1859(-)
MPAQEEALWRLLLSSGRGQAGRQSGNVALRAHLGGDRRNEASLGIRFHLRLGLRRSASASVLVGFPVLRLVLAPTVPNLLATPALRDGLISTDDAEMLQLGPHGRQRIVELDLQGEASLCAPVGLELANVVVPRTLHKHELLTACARHSRMEALAAFIGHNLVLHPMHHQELAIIGTDFVQDAEAPEICGKGLQDLQARLLKLLTPTFQRGGPLGRAA